MAQTKTNIAKKINRFAVENLECARSILANQGRYGGEHSIMVQWAKLVIARAAAK